MNCHKEPMSPFADTNVTSAQSESDFDLRDFDIRDFDLSYFDSDDAIPAPHLDSTVGSLADPYEISASIHENIDTIPSVLSELDLASINYITEPRDKLETIHGSKIIHPSLAFLGKQLDGLNLTRSISDINMEIANALFQVLDLILYITD